MSVIKPILPKAQPADRAAHRSANGWFRGAGLGSHSGAVDVLETWVIPLDHPDPLAELDRLLTAEPADEPAAGSGWAILMSYELGGLIEPKSGTAHARLAPAFPAIVAQRLGHTVQDVLEDQDAPTAGFTLGPLRSSMGRERYLPAVERVRDYIAAGDIYQANIAHQLQSEFCGSAYSCARVLLDAAKPRYGAAMGFAFRGVHHSVCSLSPELFLRFDAGSRVIRTEPMKGTRPIGGDQRELEHSPKDRAELNMITDLMRNDLGRVCRLGSVRVTEPRKIESHADSVLQASSVVEGTLRDGVGMDELIRATFPPGSVTGAPKVRAMQIIDELEQQPRNAYCGSLMTLDAAGNICASVSIRTAHIWGECLPERPDELQQGQLVYPVGAGIVADSDAAGEWEETQVNSAVLRTALGAWFPATGNEGCV